ncbi:hypothetical protein RB595_010186 [Gaeumannomyces hyphopodioides]
MDRTAYHDAHRNSHPTMHTDISLWLEGVPLSQLGRDKRRRGSLHAAGANKRRATAPLCPQHDALADGAAPLHTPPVSRKGAANNMDTGMETGADTRGRQTPEAKRHSGSRDDADETPRPGRIVPRRAIHGFQSQSADPSETDSQSRSSGRTRTSSRASTRKRRRQLEVGHEPVKVFTFASASSQDQNDFALPLPLQELLRDFETVHDGAIPFVSQSRKPELVALGFRDSAYFKEQSCQGEQGRKEISENLESPSLQCVREILDATAECHEEWYDEAGWNAAVHFPLLRLAIPRRSQVNVTPCTSARIQRDYLPASSQNGNMVDFCLSIDPKWPKGRMATTPALQAIDSISSRLPGFSINHTDFRALSQKPIAVSIETKCLGGSVKTAEVQLGVWQAAQWKMLDALTKLKPERDPPESLPLSLPRPDFLPAIYIVGHEWKFAATIKRGNETILLTECLLGSTNRVQDIYKIIWAVRRLARYSVEQYWPWFLSSIL